MSQEELWHQRYVHNEESSSIGINNYFTGIIMASHEEKHQQIMEQIIQ